ncbi:MAG: hypothetical protein MHM6MM_005672 [Cercozoa sp. M6MM]
MPAASTEKSVASARKAAAGSTRKKKKRAKKRSRAASIPAAMLGAAAAETAVVSQESEQRSETERLKRPLWEVMRESRSGEPTVEVAQRLRKNREKRRKRRKVMDAVSAEDESGSSEESLSPTKPEPEPEPTAPVAKKDDSAGVRVTVQDGKIVIARESLFVEQPDVEERSKSLTLTDASAVRHVTAASYGRRRSGKVDRWTDEETERFFLALRQFGTDFSLIAQLFPTRTRRQVTSKGKKEEREQLSRVNEALHSRVDIDVAEFETKMNESRRVERQRRLEEKRARGDSDSESEDEEGETEQGDNTNVKTADTKNVTDRKSGCDDGGDKPPNALKITQA